MPKPYLFSFTTCGAIKSQHSTKRSARRDIVDRARVRVYKIPSTLNDCRKDCDDCQNSTEEFYLYLFKEQLPIMSIHESNPNAANDLSEMKKHTGDS
jgi:hypothetical protein